MSLLTKVDQRSYGEEVKRYTYISQGLSSVIFISLSIFLFKETPYFLLFLFEGIGQLFLTLQNKNSLENNDLQISYFKKSPLSNLALFSFTIVVFARLWLLSSLYPDSENVIIGSSIGSVFIWYLLFFKSSLRRDILSGSFITLSSLIVGVCFLLSEDNIFIGLNFISYSLLILLSTIFIKPWKAEVLNIILWVHLFFLVTL
jgi:hypothetical protein